AGGPPWPWSDHRDFPAQNLRVLVSANLDLQTHHLTWYFTSVKLSDGSEPPLNQGVLPPNNAQHDGEGSVQFTVLPKPGLGSVSIANSAAITLNDPPAHTTAPCNVSLDNTPPASHVKPLAAGQDPGRYLVQWEPVGSWPDLR